MRRAGLPAYIPRRTISFVTTAPAPTTTVYTTCCRYVINRAVNAELLHDRLRQSHRRRQDAAFTAEPDWQPYYPGPQTLNGR